jgi:hypothetical protein
MDTTVKQKGSLYEFTQVNITINITINRSYPMKYTKKTTGIKNLSFSLEREDARIEKERQARRDRITKATEGEQSKERYAKLIGR